MRKQSLSPFVLLINLWLLSLVGGFGLSDLYAKPKSLDYVRIIVNSQMLTANEVQEGMRALAYDIEQNVPEGEERTKQLQALEQTTIDGLVNKLLFLDRARELKLDVSEKEIEEQLEYLLESNPRYAQQYTESELKEQIVWDMKQQRVLQFEVEGRMHIDEAEVLALCKKESDVRELGVAQILLRGKSLAEVKVIEQSIRKGLEEGLSFDVLAAKYSDDPSAQTNGGKLGSFTQGKLLKEIDDVVFTLKLGEMSAPVQTQVGYHLLYIYDVKQTNGVDCAKLTPEQNTKYYNLAFKQKREQKLQDYLTQLKKTARITIKPVMP